MERRSQSLLGRIARYGVSAQRNPREDRLTAICEAVLDEQVGCPGLAREIALAWLRSAADDKRRADAHAHFQLLHDRLQGSREWTCRTRAQVRLETPTGLRRPDLELKFSSPSDPRAVVLWVEVKHGTPPHTKQLRTYGEELAKRGSVDGVVLLVAPRADYGKFPDAEIPDDVPKLTWQDTAAAVGAYEAPTAVAGYVKEQLLGYMREEGLVPPDKLGPEHISALRYYYEGVDALLEVCGRAAALIDRTPIDHGEWRGRQFWWTYESPLATPDRWLGWNLLLDAAEVFKDGVSGVPCVAAGMTGNAGMIDAFGARVESELAEIKFEILRKGESNGAYEYVQLQAYLDEVAGLGSGLDLDTQAHALATWAAQALDDLERRVSAG